VAAETVPASVGTEAFHRIKFISTIASATLAPTAAEWDAGADITYSLTPDGWNPSQDQATVVDERLTLAQTQERAGKKTKSLEVKYVDGAVAGSAAVTLTEGTAGFIGIRPMVANATAGAAAQKVVIWPVTCGEQRDDAPVANGVFTKSQKLFVTGQVTRVAMLA
jgi:hypothetical protein